MPHPCCLRPASSAPPKQPYRDLGPSCCQSWGGVQAGSWSWRPGGRQASVGRTVVLTSTGPLGRPLGVALVFLVGWGRPPATGQDPWHGPRMCSLQGPQSYRQANPPHDGPASVGLGAKPGPPSLWARASWTLRDWVPGGQHLCCSGTAPRGSVLWSRPPSISARGGPAGHWPGSGQACVLPHRVSR